MPRIPKYSPDVILEAAFGILRTSGWHAVSSRAIAETLNTSTMPIYSAVGSMKDLEKRLKAKVYQSLAEYQTSPYTPNVLLNMAVGQVLFARDEPFLYRFIFLDSPGELGSPERRTLEREVEKRLGTPLPFAAYFDRAALRKLDQITLNAWLFTHGLSMAVMNGLLGAVTEKRIVSLLEGAGGAFVLWEKRKTTSAQRRAQ